MKSFQMIVAASCVALVSGCSSLSISPELAELKGARIGVVTIMDNAPLQVYAGTTGIDAWEQYIDSDWEFAITASTHLQQQHGKTAAFIHIEPNQTLLDSVVTRSSIFHNSGHNQAYFPALSAVIKENNLDALIAITPWHQPIEGTNTGTDFAGYGLAIRCFLRECESYALDHYKITVYRGDPLRTLQHQDRLSYEGDYYRTQTIALDLPSPIDEQFQQQLHRLPLSESSKAKPVVLQQLKQRLNDVVTAITQ